ncbi:hypothetical protein UlMin_014290 [Ulmus minor]
MAIHLYKTSTPSTRKGAVDSQVKSNPRNNLIYGQHRCGKGRNARGIISVRHRGGGHKRLYRKIDFRRNAKDIYGRIVTIEYDPNRNAYICLIYYGHGEKRYILHPRGTIIGDTIVSGTEVPEEKEKKNTDQRKKYSKTKKQKRKKKTKHKKEKKKKKRKGKREKKEQKIRKRVV